MTPKRIYLVRHGRSAANDDSTLYSRPAMNARRTNIMDITTRLLSAAMVAAIVLPTAMAGTAPGATYVAMNGEGGEAPAAESPFSTPLTAEESVAPTGKDTPVENLFPPDLGFRFGMARWRVRLFHWGLRRDGESGRDILYAARPPRKLGYGTVELEFDDGRLASIYNFWSYDTGCTAKNPGAVRERLNYALRHLGPPTRHWKQVTQDTLTDGSIRVCAWHVWHWSKGDQDAVFEIRRMDDATESLRASFLAGTIYDRTGYFNWLGAPSSIP